MFNRKVLIIGLIAVLAVGVVFLTLTNQPLQALAFSAQPAAQVAIVPVNAAQPIAPSTGAQPPPVNQATGGSNSVQVPGMFTAPNQATLAFNTSATALTTVTGRIAQISVQEGAQVKKGDTLAVLDTTALNLSVKQAQAGLVAAQARLKQAKTPATDADINAAQAAVAAAQANFDKIHAGANASDLKAGQSALYAAQQAYAKVKAGPTNTDLAQLQAQVANAQAAVDQAQAAYDKIGGATNPYIALAPQAKALQQATNNYTAALAAYNGASTHPTAAELAAAATGVQQAQAAIARLSPDAAAQATAAAQLQQAQDALARLTPTADTIAIAQSAVDQAQVGVDIANEQLANGTITAPFDGTVLTIIGHVGDSVSSASPVMTLADLSHLQFQAPVDQILLEQLQSGQAVSIVADAFKDKPITGKISRIGSLANNSGGVTTIVVTMDVDPNGVPLRPGLTGSAQLQATNQ